jgi:hypothetical protein
MPTHWSGPLGTGETVLMIINPSDDYMDLSLQWRQIPAFQNSPARIFYFAEISTREVWRSGSTGGFIYSGVPAHGSLVMIIWEGGKALYGEEVREWVHGEYVHTE